jgi:hypothetical protein
MAITYNSYVSQIATLTAITSSVLVNGDNNFGGIFPAVIDYAEGRLWRDLDLPAARVTDTSTNIICSSGVRTINLSTTQGTVLVIETLNIFSSAGTTSSNASRVPLTPTSKAVIDCIYPTALSSQCGQPEYFARVTDVQIMFGPTPDQPYGTEMIGTIRPNPLSASNSSTWLTINVPELMIAAGMVFMAGHMRDFGAQSDNPQMAQSWESQYKMLLASQNVDSLRMKFQSNAWSDQIPSPIATPPRV